MSTPAGWYSDAAGRLRWWDGVTWTASVAAPRARFGMPPPPVPARGRFTPRSLFRLPRHPLLVVFIVLYWWPYAAAVALAWLSVIGVRRLLAWHARGRDRPDRHGAIAGLLAVSAIAAGAAVAIGRGADPGLFRGAATVSVVTAILAWLMLRRRTGRTTASGGAVPAAGVAPTGEAAPAPAASTAGSAPPRPAPAPSPSR